MNSLILGLMSGTACLSSCAPIILPYYLNKGESVARNYVDLALFTLGRLAGYLLFGIIAFFVGKIFLENNPYRNFIVGGSYIMISVILLLGFFKERICLARRMDKLTKRIKNSGIWFSLLLGFATGLNLCPSFALVFTQASNMKSVFESIWFFFLFFIGTTVYFLPLPLVGFMKGKKEVKIVGRFLILFTCIWFTYKGILMILILGGIQ